MTKHITQNRRCICGHERQCQGMSLAFQMLQDPRGGHVEVPPACAADPPAYEYLHRMNELRRAYFRHLGKTEEHNEMSSIADAEASLPQERQFVALHHFHPKVIRRVANASSSTGRGRSAIRQQVPPTLTLKEIRRMRLELTAVSSEADRVITVNGEPTEEFFFVPHYPMEDAHQDLKELSRAERSPFEITKDVYENAKKEIQAQKKQKQKKANKKKKDKKATSRERPAVVNLPIRSQEEGVKPSEALEQDFSPKESDKQPLKQSDKQSPKEVIRDNQAVMENAEDLEDSNASIPRLSLMDASEQSFSIHELMRHRRSIIKKTPTLPTIESEKVLGASDTTVISARRPPKSSGNDETLGASDSTVVNQHGAETVSSSFYASNNESIQVTDSAFLQASDGTFHESDLTERASGATARMNSSDTTIQASNVPGAPKGYHSSSNDNSGNSMWGSSSLSAAQIASEFPLEELPKRQSPTSLPDCEPTQEASPVALAAAAPSLPLSRRSNRDEVQKAVSVAESVPMLADSTDETTDDATISAMTHYCSSEDIDRSDEAAAGRDERVPRRLRNSRTPIDRTRSVSPSTSPPVRRAAIAVSNPGELFRPENNRQSRRSPRRTPRRTKSADGSADVAMDASFTSLLAMKQVVQAKTVDRSLSPPLRRANTDTGVRMPVTHKMNASLRSIDESKVVASASPRIARSCRKKGETSPTHSLSPPGLRRANTDTYMGSKPSLSRQMMNQSLRSFDDELDSSDSSRRRMALTQPMIGELSPKGLRGNPKIKRIDSSIRAMQYFVHESGAGKPENPSRARSPQRVATKSSRGRSVSPKRPPSAARVSEEATDAINASSPAILGYRYGSSAKTMVRLSSVPDMKPSSIPTPAVQSGGSKALMSRFNNRTDSCPSFGLHGRTPLSADNCIGALANDNSSKKSAASNLNDSLRMEELYNERTTSHSPLIVDGESQGKPMPSQFNHSYPFTKKVGTETGLESFDLCCYNDKSPGSPASPSISMLVGKKGSQELLPEDIAVAKSSVDERESQLAFKDSALTDEHTKAGRVGFRQALQHMEHDASYVSLDLGQVFTGPKDSGPQQPLSTAKSQGSQLQESSASIGLRQDASAQECCKLDQSGCMEREKLRSLFPFRNIKEKRRDSLTKSPPASLDSSQDNSARCKLDDSGCMEPERLRVLFPFQSIKAKRIESHTKSPHASSDTLDNGTTPSDVDGLTQLDPRHSNLVSYSTFTSKPQLSMEHSRQRKVEALQLMPLPEIDEEESPSSSENKLEASSERGSDLDLPPLVPMTSQELPQSNNDKIVHAIPAFTPPLSSDVWNNENGNNPSDYLASDSTSCEDSFAAQTTNSSLQEEFNLSFPSAQALVQRELPSADMCLSSPSGNVPIDCGRELLDRKIDCGMDARLVSLRDLKITTPAMPKASKGKGKAGGQDQVKAKNDWKKQPRTEPTNGQDTEFIREYMLSLV